MTNADNFAEKFQLSALTLANFGHWTVSLRPEQPTLGSLVLSANSASGSLSSLSVDELAELRTVFLAIERGLGASFAPDKFNYLALMMVDARVHFHVLPRYSSPRLVLGRELTDRWWPKAPELQPIDLSDEERSWILGELSGKF